MSAGRDAARSDRRRPHVAAALAFVLLLPAGCGEDPVTAVPGCDDLPPIVPGAPLPAALEGTDPIFQGAYVDFYALTLRSRADVTIAMRSAAFDPLVFLFDDGATLTAQAFQEHDVPAGSTEEARLHHRLPPGCYVVGATSWADAATGLYTIDASAGDG